MAALPTGSFLVATKKEEKLATYQQRLCIQLLGMIAHLQESHFIICNDISPSHCLATLSRVGVVEGWGAGEGEGDRAAFSSPYAERNHHRRRHHRRQSASVDIVSQDGAKKKKRERGLPNQ